MTQRRKLLADKILDGSTVVYGAKGTPSYSAILGGLKAQKFVFSENSLDPAITYINSQDGYLEVMSTKSPYEVVWLENETGTKAWIVYSGSLESLSAMHLPEGDVPNQELFTYFSKFPDECVADMYKVYCLINTPEIECGLLPFVTYMSRKPSSNNGIPRVTQLIYSAMNFEESSESNQNLAKQLSQIPQYVLFGLGVKNATTQELVTVPKDLANARAKRGKPPLSNYTYIRSNMTPSASTGTGGTKAAHLVRGHFKRRKTGVYWWKPHVAGSGELKERKAYIV